MHCCSNASKIDINRQVVAKQTVTTKDHPGRDPLPRPERCVYISMPTPGAAWNAIDQEKSPRELVLCLLLHLGFLQRPLRTSLAPAVDGANRRHYSHGLDSAVGLHGWPWAGLMGEREVA